MIVTPAWLSPSVIARLIGAAPRQRGSKDECTLIQNFFGLDNIAGLEIDMIAPQHGPVYRGQAVTDFLGWIKDLQCGVDLMQSGGFFPKESR